MSKVLSVTTSEHLFTVQILREVTCCVNLRTLVTTWVTEVTRGKGVMQGRTYDIKTKHLGCSNDVTRCPFYKKASLSFVFGSVNNGCYYFNRCLESCLKNVVGISCVYLLTWLPNKSIGMSMGFYVCTYEKIYINLWQLFCYTNFSEARFLEISCFDTIERYIIIPNSINF